MTGQKKKQPRFRRMLVTLENYQKHGLDHEAIAAILTELHEENLRYGCFDLELGSTPHAHVYLVYDVQVCVSTVKRAFGDFVHIDQARGSHAQCIAYVEKSGDSIPDEKRATQVPGSFWEIGQRPLDKADKNKKVWEGVYALARTGEVTALEILETYPSLSSQLAKVELLVERFKAEKAKKEWREIETLILHGKTSTGKTTWAYENYGEKGLYRVTDYEHPYEGYSGEPVICYDEMDWWAKSMRISTILQLTDKFPLGAALDRRYANLVPEFSTCIFISNEPPSEMYPQVTRRQWNAFLRRVSHIYRFDGLNQIVEEDKSIYER